MLIRPTEATTKAATTMRDDNYYTQRGWMMQIRRCETPVASAAAGNSAWMQRGAHLVCIHAHFAAGTARVHYHLATT